MSSMTDFLFSGVLVDFPRLTLAYSEGQMGWVPYILERADDVWEEHRAWGGVRDRICQAVLKFSEGIHAVDDTTVVVVQIAGAAA